MVNLKSDIFSRQQNDNCQGAEYSSEEKFDTVNSPEMVVAHAESPDMATWKKHVARESE